MSEMSQPCATPDVYVRDSMGGVPTPDMYPQETAYPTETATGPTPTVYRRDDGERGYHRKIAEDTWYLKNITFDERPVRIVMQGMNGPCSFIAICNILLLRGNILILPPERQTVAYEFLSQLVAEYLLTSCPDVDISAGLTVMPRTQYGMDLNPLFTGASSFRPQGGELQLFEHAHIALVHGWLVDPASPEGRVVAKYADYDAAVTLIAAADYTSEGRLVVEETADYTSGVSLSLSDEEREKVEDAMTIRAFLSSTQSQLTYDGLFHLSASLAPGSLVALYRNQHLSVLHKHVAGGLYALVTDGVFVAEPSVVWERLEDVDGRAAVFVDAGFVRASPVGGDWAGETVEGVVRREEEAGGDLALARRLQWEEDQRAGAPSGVRAGKAKANKDKGRSRDCVVV